MSNRVIPIVICGCSSMVELQPLCWIKLDNLFLLSKIKEDPFTFKMSFTKGTFYLANGSLFLKKRVMGIEPTLSAWYQII